MKYRIASIILIAAVVVGWFVIVGRDSSVSVPVYQGPLFETKGRILTRSVSEGELSLFLAGDALITQPWSNNREPDFLKLIEEIRATDVAIVNLETLIHTYKGYAQADSGGTYMATRPEIAAELVWAGIDMVAHANNHAFDYGSIGVLENLQHVAKSGLVLAGSGKDLQDARAPRYFQHPDGKVALVSAASSFITYGKASRSRPDIHGRPGLNPLELKSGIAVTITRATARVMQGAAEALGFSGYRYHENEFRKWGIDFVVGDSHDVTFGTRIVKKDLDGNLASVREAAANADLVVVSVHAHAQGQWLQDFARRSIDAGADVFFAQGPHFIRGIEIYKGKPIFYCLGDFVFQAEQTELLPSESYERYGLGDEATPKDAKKTRSANGTRGPITDRKVWEAFAAAIRFKDGRVLEIRLLPMELGFGQPLPRRGTPHYAGKERGRPLIEEVFNRSHQHGTEIRYVPRGNLGVVIIP
jgi:poly-gamma-glutamate synthesis protein (capsule biosynthesis protein)